MVTLMRLLISHDIPYLPCRPAYLTLEGRMTMMSVVTFLYEKFTVVFDTSSDSLDEISVLESHSRSNHSDQTRQYRRVNDPTNRRNWGDCLDFVIFVKLALVRQSLIASSTQVVVEVRWHTDNWRTDSWQRLPSSLLFSSLLKTVNLWDLMIDQLCCLQ